MRYVLKGQFFLAGFVAVVVKFLQLFHNAAEVLCHIVFQSRYVSLVDVKGLIHLIHGSINRVFAGNDLNEGESIGEIPAPLEKLGNVTDHPQ
jgi:hypothetical protein